MTKGKKKTKKETKPPTEEAKSEFEIKTYEDYKRMIILANGGDPDAVQALAKYMNSDSMAERSYFPDRITALGISQLNIFGDAYFPSRDNDPFTISGNKISEGFMGYKGFKSNQVMEITRNTPNLDALQAVPQEQKQGFISRFLGGNRE